MPDVLGADRDRYAGKHTLVVVAGCSAANTLLSLAQLADEGPGTRISWNRVLPSGEMVVPRATRVFGECGYRPVFRDEPRVRVSWSVEGEDVGERSGGGVSGGERVSY